MRLWQSILTAIAALLGLPEHGLAQARSVPETMQIDDQPGYVANPDDERLPAPFQRQMVFYRTTEAPGTIIVHTSERFLYVVQPNSRAIRYGIGVGRDGFRWSGLLKITRKGEWPDWTPPPEMIARQPYLPRFMAGGPGNPLGARALYLGKHCVSHSRHQSTADHRSVDILRLLSPRQRRRDRSLRAHAGRHQGDCAPDP
jgi:lipoprotein-anchoring transpeptidase ErfK/SrfK